MKLAPRSVTLNLGGRIMQVRMWPPKSVVREERLECKFFVNPKTLTTPAPSDIDIQASDPILGLHVKLSLPVSPTSMSVEKVNLQVRGASGWINLDGLKRGSLDGQQLGKIRMVQARGNISELLLDGTPQVPRQVETYSALGSFEATYVQGKLRVLGQGQRLWKDRTRLSATKWEKLDQTHKMAFFGVLLSAIAFIGNVVRRRVATDKPFDWMN